MWHKEETIWREIPHPPQNIWKKAFAACQPKLKVLMKALKKSRIHWSSQQSYSTGFTVLCHQDQMVIAHQISLGKSEAWHFHFVMAYKYPSESPNPPTCSARSAWISSTSALSTEAFFHFTNKKTTFFSLYWHKRIKFISIGALTHSRDLLPVNVAEPENCFTQNETWGEMKIKRGRSESELSSEGWPWTGSAAAVASPDNTVSWNISYLGQTCEFRHRVSSSISKQYRLVRQSDGTMEDFMNSSVESFELALNFFMQVSGNFVTGEFGSSAE